MWMIGGPRDGQVMDAPEGVSDVVVPVAPPRPVRSPDGPAEFKYTPGRYCRRLWSIVGVDVQAWLFEGLDPHDAVWDLIGLTVPEARAEAGQYPDWLRRDNARGCRRLAGRLWQYWRGVWNPMLGRVPQHRAGGAADRAGQ